MSQASRAATYRALARRAHPGHTRPATIAGLATETGQTATQVRRDLLALQATRLVSHRPGGWVASAPTETGDRTFDELRPPADLIGGQ